MNTQSVGSFAGRVQSSSSRMDRTASGEAAGVEIVGFPQLLYTRTFGAPDMLFVPLLDAAREAHGMITRLADHGENHNAAVMLSGMHLASSLLRDTSFSLSARGPAHESLYTVDLEAGTLHVRTRLYAVVSRRTSFFKVEIAGKITVGPYVVRDPTQGSVILQIEEDRLRQPNYFSTSLAQECLRAQIDQERFGTLEENPSKEVHSEIRMVVPVGPNRIPVILRQKTEGGGWDILDGRRQEWVGTLPSDAQADLAKVSDVVRKLFAQK